MLAILLTLLCAGGVMGARAAGRDNSPAVAAIFTLPDGKPCVESCLFGVLPGQTRHDEAVRLLQIHPLTRKFSVVSTSPYRIEGHADLIMMVSFNATPDGVVDEITLANYIRYSVPATDSLIDLPDNGTLGDIFGMFGQPDFLQMTNGGDPALIFNDAHVIARLFRLQGDRGRMLPRQPLSRLTVFRPTICGRDGFIYVFPRWIGMAHIRRYAYSTQSVDTFVRHINSAGGNFAPCNR
jgi:hypothetical protein